MVYCVVPSETASRVKRALDRTLRDDADVVLLVDRRGFERRRGIERRRHVGPHVVERRRVGYPDGRRVADRRSVLVPVSAPPAVGRAARNAEGVLFVEPLEVPEDFRRDVDAVRAIIRCKSGESDIGELYERWFDPVYTYLSVTLDRGEDVEAGVSTVLAEVLHRLTAATPGPTEVRRWLFGIVYECVRPRRQELPLPLSRDDARGEPDPAAERGLAWLSDGELLLLIARRPPAERHVLVLRYFAGLTFGEIGTVMKFDPSEAIALHRSAVASLDATLAAAGRGTRLEERHPMARLTQPSPTLRQRRRALLAA